MPTILTAVADEEWQKFRLSLKGLYTEEKLDLLADFRLNHIDQFSMMVCVDNYINALRRGGQLDAHNRVTERP